MSIANYFKLPKDASFLILWKPIAPNHHEVNKGWSWMTKKNERFTANCAQRFVLEHRYSDTANRLCLFPDSLTVVAFLLREASITYSLIHVVSLNDPKRWKGTWDCGGCLYHLSLPTMSRPHRECGLALYVIGDSQRWPSTFGAS